LVVVSRVSAGFGAGILADARGRSANRWTEAYRPIRDVRSVPRIHSQYGPGDGIERAPRIAYWAAERKSCPLNPAVHRGVLLAPTSQDEIVQLADAGDACGNPVARFQKLPAGAANARGRSGQDDIARPQGQPARQIRDLLRDRENHPACIRALLHLAVDKERDSQFLRIGDLRRRNDPWPERARGVETLVSEPIESERRVCGNAIASAQIARRQVIGDRIPGDTCQRPVDRNIPRLESDYGGELDLPVELVRARGNLDP